MAHETECSFVYRAIKNGCNVNRHELQQLPRKPDWWNMTLDSVSTVESWITH